MYNRYNEFHQVEGMVRSRVESELIYECGRWRLQSKWDDYNHDDEDDDAEYLGPIEQKSEGS